MRCIRLLVLCCVIIAPAASLADLRSDALPEDTVWYVHADFALLRDGGAGRPIYDWLQRHVFDEIRGESGIDLDEEADYLTAVAAENGDTVIIVGGDISQATEDKLMAIGAASGSMDQRESGGAIYFHVKNDASDAGKYDVDAGAFNSGAYFSFAKKGTLIVTSSEEGMAALLAGNGSIEAMRGNSSDLLVLRAERSLMQAGAQTARLQGDEDWDSNILRNTEQAALLISEQAGDISIEAHLVATDVAIAESLASIVRGLIGLQALNKDINSGFAAILRGTVVNIDGNQLKVSLVVDPKVLVAAFE